MVGYIIYIKLSKQNYIVFKNVRKDNLPTSSKIPTEVFLAMQLSTSTTSINV